MRSVLVLLVAVGLAGWVGMRHLPARDAQAAMPGPTSVTEVQSITIEGHDLPLADLRALISTHTGRPVDSAELEHDRAALSAELVRRGHLSARVEPAVVTFGPRGGAYVTFDVDQGPRFKLRDVTLVGATADEAVVTLSAGDDVDAARIERARQVVEDSLGRRGKRGTVTVRQLVDHAAGVVDVELSFVR